VIARREDGKARSTDDEEDVEEEEEGTMARPLMMDR
jgi:hypothetical protein